MLTRGVFEMCRIFWEGSGVLLCMSNVYIHTV